LIACTFAVFKKNKIDLHLTQIVTAPVFLDTVYIMYDVYYVKCMMSKEVNKQLTFNMSRGCLDNDSLRQRLHH